MLRLLRPPLASMTQTGSIASIDCADSGGPGTTSNGQSRRNRWSAKLSAGRVRRLALQRSPAMVDLYYWTRPNGRKVASGGAA